MLVKTAIGGILTLAVFFIGYNLGQYQAPTAEAINVVGAEVITTDANTATFRVFKTSSQTLETDTAAIDKKLKGQDRGEALKIADQATADLQFLNNFHQSLADLQAQFPCPGVECDPDIETDPARCSLFWEDLDPKLDHPIIPGNPNDTLTSRNTIITVFWNGTIYSIRLADPSSNPANFPDNC